MLNIVEENTDQDNININFGVDLTTLFETNKGVYSEIADVHKRNTTMGLAPLYNKIILKADLLNNALFLQDLRISTLDNSLNFIDVESNKIFIDIIARQGSLITSAKILPMADNKTQTIFNKHVLLSTRSLDVFFSDENVNIPGFDFKTSKRLANSYEFINRESFYFKHFLSVDSFAKHRSNLHSFVFLDTQLMLMKNDPSQALEMRGLYDNWNLSTGLYQAN